MDTKKLVILILVVIAILCAMALGAGLYQGSDLTAKDSTKDWFPNRRPEHTTLDSGRLHAVTGCTVSGSGTGGRITMAGLPCDIVITGTRKWKPQTLWLEPSGSKAYACYKMSRDEFARCPATPDNSVGEFKGKSSLAVGRDSAFLRLYCIGAINPSCVFAIK